MEQLFSFEIKEILWNLDKIKIIDSALLYSCEIEKPFAWKCDLEQLYKRYFNWNFQENSVFGKSIWSSYNKPELRLLADFLRKVANFAKTL